VPLIPGGERILPGGRIIQRSTTRKYSPHYVEECSPKYAALTCSPKGMVCAVVPSPLLG
jgi:hypothetical protein